MPMKILALAGMSPKDESVITSLLGLVSDRMSQEWQIDNASASPDCLLVNTMTEDGLALWRSLRSRGTQKVAFANGNPPSDAEFVINSPIRAAQLVELLEKNTGTGQQVEMDIPQTPVSRYQLKRWPDVGALRTHPDYTRLCAALMRHALTPESLSETTGIQLSVTQAFIAMCQEKGWLTGVEGTPALMVTSDSERSVDRGLFSKIRARLGLAIQ